MIIMNIIDAIKLVRRILNIGLLDAKVFVESVGVYVEAPNGQHALKTPPGTDIVLLNRVIRKDDLLKAIVQHPLFSATRPEFTPYEKESIGITYITENPLRAIEAATNALRHRS